MFRRPVGGQCRFYPCCSHYAEDAIRAHAAPSAACALAAWRILRCNPFGRGGVERVRGGALYDACHTTTRFGLMLAEIVPWQWLLNGLGLGPRPALRRRRQLRRRDHRPHDLDQDRAAAVGVEADQVDAARAGAPAPDQGAPEEVQEQQAEAAGRNDEPVQGGRASTPSAVASRPAASPVPHRDVLGDPAGGARPRRRRRGRASRCMREQPHPRGQRPVPHRSSTTRTPTSCG